MNLMDLVSTVNAIFELIKNVSELPHMDKMPDVIFFLGVSLNSNKATKEQSE